MSCGRGHFAGPHLDTAQWLKVLDLDQYTVIFDKFAGVEDLLDFSEADIKSLGVKNSAHRARMASSLVVLRNKYGQRGGEKPEDQMHSVAPDNSGCGRADGSDSVTRIADDSCGVGVLCAVGAVVHSKSLCNLKMDSMPDSGLDQGQLRKALEWELSLDARDLRSHAWYHGSIPRARAEEIIENDGDFLVRDCSSQPGNYVLSTKTKGQCLHFVINKVILQPDTVYERIQYQFEDEAYDTVSDLITYYVGSGKPISALSGARIQVPRNRFQPLSFYAAKYGTVQGQLGSAPCPHSAPGNARYSTFNATLSQSPVRQKKELPPRLPGKQRSLSLTPAEFNGKLHGALDSGGERSSSADGVIRGGIRFPTNSLPRTAKRMSDTVTGSATRVTSDSASSPLLESREGEQDGARHPPPKPSRVPSLTPGTEPRVEAAPGPGTRSLSGAPSYQAFGSDSGNGSSDSAQSSAAGDANEAAPTAGSPASLLRGVIIKNPRYGMTSSASSSTLKAIDYDHLAENDLVNCIPEVTLTSAFDLENFQTLLLPTLENKPVDHSALQCVKTMLEDNGSRVLANHLTRVDLEITVYEHGNSQGSDTQPNLKCAPSGIELCTLPQGRQLRLDIVERAECLKLLVAVTILTCTNVAERAETLHKWIQVAIDVKTAVGNLFGFSAIMLGLCLPQVQRLTDTWHVLRQKFTDSAFNYEAKLRPTLKNMNECTNPQAPNTTIPHLLPFVLLQDITLDDVLGMSGNSVTSPASDFLLAFESAIDSGLTTLFAHLESGRKFANMLPFYRRNAEIILGDAKIDDLLLDMFRTEFHLKFLWGSRGASVCSEERRTKFDQVLTLMSEKCEPSGMGRAGA